MIELLTGDGRIEQDPAKAALAEAVEAATVWLLRDHDERVTTGTVRPARERAAELVAAVRWVIYREAAARLHQICGQEGHGGDCPLVCDRGSDVLLLEDWAAKMEADHG